MEGVSSARVVTGLFILAAVLVWRTFSRKYQHVWEQEERPSHVCEIEPIKDFRWDKTAPVKLRPFKPTYHLTMAIETISASELLEMDENYLDRIRLRRRVMKENPQITLAAEDVVVPAVKELYEYLLGYHLPQRFPQMFQLTEAKSDGRQLHNLVTDEYFPSRMTMGAVAGLEILGGLIDEDFLILLPSTDGDSYTLKGFVMCFPSGFDTSKKLNLKLRDIHTPVPGYAAKIGKSMDRFFEKLPVGKFVRRANWSITTTNQLFTPKGNHLYSGETVAEEEVDISKCRVRCERQVLHRMPKTNAIVFSLKTYLYCLEDIKSEGLGEDLATAIDGLKKGNVPEMQRYKRAVVWGEPVKAFLRGEPSPGGSTVC